MLNQLYHQSLQRSRDTRASPEERDYYANLALTILECSKSYQLYQTSRQEKLDILEQLIYAFKHPYWIHGAVTSEIQAQLDKKQNLN